MMLQENTSSKGIGTGEGICSAISSSAYLKKVEIEIASYAVFHLSTAMILKT